MPALAVAIVTALPAAPARGQRPEPLLRDYVAFSVTAPPESLRLDPFYTKYVDAHGIPVVGSARTPDAALLVARDMVQWMLANRPDLRAELVRKRWKLAIMAETERTFDIPDHRRYRALPKIDDERLTPQQRESYHKPGGVGTMTAEQYWNARGRGFGGEPDGENTTSCAEENLLGYPGTRYFGASICVHEFSHGIMRGAIYTVDPAYRKAVEEAYADAKARGRASARGYAGNNLNEYWATGIEAYVFGSGRGPETLRRDDPRLYELVARVIPGHAVPGNVYTGRTRR
jgi:hypothetical protein